MTRNDRFWVIPAVWCLVVTLVLAVAYSEVRWSYVDLANNLMAASDNRSWRELVSDALTKSSEYRPLLDVGTRAAYKVIGLGLTTYRTIVLVEFALILGALVLLFRPIGWQRAGGATLALSIAVGLHTSQILFLFNPLNAYATAMLLILTAALLVLSPRLRGYEWVLFPVTLGALLWLEIGVLIVPLVGVAWLLKAPGATWRSVAASSAALGIYLVARLGFSPGTSLGSPDTGLGFSGISPAESAALFANAPWLFWLYNVGATLMTVLLSEPRAGRFQFIEAALRGNVPFWMWLHVLSSLATTAVVLFGLLGIRRRPRRDQLLAAFGAVLIFGGSVLGFLYTRDRIGLPVGLGYAMLAYVAVAALLERRTPGWLAVPAAALVAVLGICWTIRTGEMYVALRDTAFDYHLEWTDRYEQFADGAHGPLVDALRASALQRYPADARRDPVWTYHLFQRRFEPLVAPCEKDARRIVDEIHNRLLGAVDGQKAANWVGKLESGANTVRDVVRATARSREYVSRLERLPGPHDAVSQLYRDLLAREPDAEGAAWATRIAANQGLTAVADELTTSSEYRHAFGDWLVPGGRMPFCR